MTARLLTRRERANLDRIATLRDYLHRILAATDADAHRLRRLAQEALDADDRARGRA